MATASIGKNSRVMVALMIPATLEALGAVSDMLEEVRTKLPPHLDHNGNWAITVRHNDGCGSKESRNMDDCTCVTLLCECVQIDDADTALLRRTGGYDLKMEIGDGPTTFN